MEVIPAVDLKGGKCVRLSQGAFNRVETYTEDPVAYAVRWEKAGARRLHVVDLDGARMGAPQLPNLAALRQILRRLSIPVQFGGGVRNLEVAQRMLGIGVERVVVGTAAAKDDIEARMLFGELGERAIAGIDARDGKVSVSGWVQQLEEDAYAFAKRVAGLGARRAVFTDIARDGMLTGPNLGALRQMLAAFPGPVIASGGVSKLADVAALAGLGAPNLEAVIVGKALYAQSVDLGQALAVARGEVGP